MRRLSNILFLVALMWCTVMPLDAAAQASSSLDYINTTKEHIKALNDSIDKCCSDSLELEARLHQEGADSVELARQLDAIHIKCDDWRELKDIAIFKECLFINLKQPYNDTIISALRPFAKETYFKSYQDFQLPYLAIIDNYGTYSDSLYHVMRDTYNNYCRKAGWQRLPRDILSYVRTRLTSQEYYRLYYLSNDKINSPHLNEVITEYLKLLDTGFTNCKAKYLELITKLRGKAPKIKKVQSTNDEEQSTNDEGKSTKGP